MSTPKGTPSVQISVPKPQPALHDMSLISQGSDDNNETIPKVSVSKPPDKCKVKQPN